MLRDEEVAYVWKGVGEPSTYSAQYVRTPARNNPFRRSVTVRNAPTLCLKTYSKLNPGNYIWTQPV